MICKDCTDEKGKCIFPVYGSEDLEHTAHFEESEDDPGFGVWAYCLYCGAPEKEDGEL